MCTGSAVSLALMACLLAQFRVIVYSHGWMDTGELELPTLLTSDSHLPTSPNWMKKAETRFKAAIKELMNSSTEPPEQV